MTCQKVWLITGCSSGIGERLVYEILKRGDKAIATSRNINKLEKLKNEGAKIIKLDVTDTLENIKDIIKTCYSIYGKIDVLVNNAGYLQYGILENVTQEEIQNQFNTNVFGLLNITKTVLPYMRSRKEGIIVNIGSVGGWKGEPAAGLYYSSKFAIEGITETLNSELKHLGIKVLIIEPGFFRTDVLNKDNFNVECISDYEELNNNMIKFANEMNKKQPGDPVKLAKVIVDVVKQENLANNKNIPDRLPVGPDAYHIIKNKCEETLKFLEEWKEIITSTNFDK
jgi:short-subunit dehydrogenase